MTTIIFLFGSEKSLQRHQNLVRDILYYGYDISIETYSEEELSLDTALKYDHYLIIFTESNQPTKDKRCRKLFDGINAIDIIEEINQECLVLN